MTPQQTTIPELEEKWEAGTLTERELDRLIALTEGVRT